jgi:signal transduction histidine kinase
VGILLLATTVFFLSFHFYLPKSSPRRRGYFLFGWTSFFLALFAIFAFLQFDTEDLKLRFFWVRLEFASLIPLTIFFFRFSAFHLGVENKFYRWILPLVNIAFLPLCFFGEWVMRAEFDIVRFHLFGWEFYYPRAFFGWVAYPFIFWNIGIALVIGRQWLRKFFQGGSQVGLPISFFLFLAAAIHDALVSLRVYPGPPLFVLGFSGFLIVMAIQLFREFLDLNRQVEIKSEQLTKINEEMRFLVWSISHDLGGPLLTIHGFTDLIRETAKEDPQAMARYLDRITANVEHMKALVNDLGNFLKIGQAEAECEEVNLKIAAQQALILLNLPDRFPKAQVEIPKDWPRYLGSAKQLKQILFNLIQNSLIHGKREDVQVKIQAFGEKNGVRLWVEDNGPGIPVEDREKIFDPLFRRSHEVAGSGMGLAIVKKIVATHHGRIWVDPAFSTGTRMVLELPFAEVP